MTDEKQLRTACLDDEDACDWDGLEPCQVCPRLISCLYMCKLLQAVARDD